VRGGAAFIHPIARFGLHWPCPDLVDSGCVNV
jgi:hypothetical protein